MKGYLEQKGTPTPDKPVEIKSKLIGKNLFETYDVNGKQYTDYIPKDTLICISKEEFIEYKQQKEEIERLNNIINELEKDVKERIDFYKQEIKEFQDDLFTSNYEEIEDAKNEIKIRRCHIIELEDTLDKIEELKGSDK